MKKLNLTILATLLAATAAVAAPVKSDIPAGLAAKAKISLDTARTTALAKVPKGQVQSEELEQEHGKLLYSFDIKAPGKSGIEEVQVDAMNGSVLGVEHETPKAEKSEAAKEAREAKHSTARQKKPPQK